MPALLAGVHLLALAALLLTGWYWREQAALGWRLSGLTAAAACVLFSWLRFGRLAVRSVTSLEIGAEQPWRFHLKGQDQPRDLTVLAWTAVGPLIALDIGSDHPKLRHRLLLARDQCSSEQWRAIRAALQWLPRN